MRQSLSYGEDTFEFEICYTPSRMTAVAIHVHPNASIQVDAPEGSTVPEICRAVQKRARWIKRQVEQATRNTEFVLPRSYVSGESHFYLGRRHHLKIVADSENKPNVKLLRGQLRIETTDSSGEAVKRLLRNWYRQRAGEVFQRRLSEIAEKVVWLKAVPDWRLLAMKKQWGSCSPDGVILLNPHLVKAPRECVDYVIVHELCHLREHNHSPRYYQLLGQLMPDWKSVKAKLDGMAELLLNE